MVKGKRQIKNLTLFIIGATLAGKMKEIPNWLRTFIPSTLHGELDNEIVLAAKRFEGEKKKAEQLKIESINIQKQNEEKISSDFKNIVEPAIRDNFNSIVPPRLLDTLNSFAGRLGVSNNKIYNWEVEDKTTNEKYRSSYVDIFVKESLIEMFNRQERCSIKICQNYKFEGYTKNGNWSFGISADSKYGAGIKLGRIWQSLDKLEDYNDDFHTTIIQEMARIIVSGGINCLCEKPETYGPDGSSTGNGSCDRDSGTN